MEVRETAIAGVRLVRPDRFGDARGWFCETYNAARYKAAGIAADFVQDNESESARGVLRGLHWQAGPHAQAKLVRVLQGAVWDVAVDVRKGSPTFGRHVAALLSAENGLQFYIPRGFGHGFVALTDDVNFCYKVDNLYSKECDRSIRFDDPAIGVEWGVSEPVLSDKDKNAPLLADSDCNFVYGKE